MKIKNIESKVWTQIQAVSSASTIWLTSAAIVALTLVVATGLTSCGNGIRKTEESAPPSRPPSPPKPATKPYILYTPDGPQIIGRPPPHQHQYQYQ